MFKFLLLVLFSTAAWSKTIKIAVIDTGYSNTVFREDVNLCPGEHADFVNNDLFLSKPPVDSILEKHGTNIAFLIDSQIDKKYKDSYCLVIIRYYSYKPKLDYLDKSNKAIEYAISIGADYINYSAGGKTQNPLETKLVKTALDKGIVFVAAAGNESENLDTKTFYPAMSDPRVIVVGNVDGNNNRVDSSNYGKVVDVWEVGHEASAGGVTLTGTSQATAIVTGKLVNSKIEKEKQNMIERMSSNVKTKGRKNGK